jgi:hypothetical protein
VSSRSRTAAGRFEDELEVTARAGWSGVALVAVALVVIALVVIALVAIALGANGSAVVPPTGAPSATSTRSSEAAATVPTSPPSAARSAAVATSRASATSAARPPAPEPFDRVTETDRLVFDVPLADFLAARQAGAGAGQLDWSTDDCSTPLPEPARSRPRGYDFRAACWRHDFGYRNAKAQGRLTEPFRQRIDDRFHQDMGDVCNGYAGWRAAQGVECRWIADQFSFWVRSCGQQPAPYCPEMAARFVHWFS